MATNLKNTKWSEQEAKIRAPGLKGLGKKT
jgi:hypothetical protein